MRRLLAVALCTTTLCSGGIAAAHEPASSFWNDAWSERSPADRSVDVYIAEAQLRARNDGYGPGHSTVNYNGDVTVNSTYNGSVTSSGSTNIVNSNSTSAYASGSEGSNVTLTVTTGQTSGSASQNASSGAGTADGPVGTIGVTTGQSSQ